MELPFIVQRNLTKDECPWLIDPLPSGTEIWLYHGHTYGVISGNGIAMTRVRGEEPFFEVPVDSIKEKT